MCTNNGQLMVQLQKLDIDEFNNETHIYVPMSYLSQVRKIL